MQAVSILSKKVPLQFTNILASAVPRSLEHNLLTRKMPDSCDTEGETYSWADMQNCFDYLFNIAKSDSAACVVTGKSTTFVTCGSGIIYGTREESDGETSTRW